MVKWCFLAEVLQQGDQLEKLILPVENRHVGREFPIDIKLISHKDWHRDQLYDDIWKVIYHVLPPM